MRLFSLAAGPWAALGLAAALMAGCGGSDGPASVDSGGGNGEGGSSGPGPTAPQVSLAGLKFWAGEQGPSGPTQFSGPQQQPFLCRTLESNLGAPEVDNQDGVGQPVYEIPGDRSSRLLGYSARCSVKTQVRYFYYTGSDFAVFDPATQFANPPANLQRLSLNGAELPFVVRVEAGTINRFAYSVAMLAPYAESADSPEALDKSAWNQKMVYWMRGGVGVGRQQGKAMWFGGLWSEERPIMPKLLAQGYAVVSSSGNETGVHYNLRLAEETAVMVKEHFVQTYGAPKYTVAMGISGGAVQQYVFGQNRPKGLFDAGVPIQSYPDMVTQAIYVSDCSLLEKYFYDEVALNAGSLWGTWSNRTLVEGLATSDLLPGGKKNKFLPSLSASSECIEGWGTAGPGVINPVFYDPAFNSVAAATGWSANWAANVKWTHWNDLENIYGRNDKGFAPIPIDNVGVQYGLKAFKSGSMDVDEFLRINACVGSWKEQEQFVNWAMASDPFDSANMHRSSDCRTAAGTPARRRSGDLGAMQAAYASGQVFSGRTLDIPLIDLRPWKEDVLDMHNSRQSFSARARLQAAGGKQDNQVIWITGETSAAGVATRAMDALAVLDSYLSTGSKPQRFMDQCFNAQGQTIAAGSTVWSGVMDDQAPGACTSSYRIYSSPRMEAGDSLRGDMFKCALKPLATALADGTYGSQTFGSAQKDWLARIFPDGVCDYSQPDTGRPAKL